MSEQSSTAAGSLALPRHRRYLGAVAAFVTVAGLYAADSAPDAWAPFALGLVGIFAALGVAMVAWPGPALELTSDDILIVGLFIDRWRLRTQRIRLDDIESATYDVPQLTGRRFQPKYVQWQPPGPRGVIIKFRASRGSLLVAATEDDAVPFVDAVQQRIGAAAAARFTRERAEPS